MSLSFDRDLGCSVWVTTTCDVCTGEDSTSDEAALWEEGWRWWFYEDDEGPHYCPDCAATHYDPEATSS